jgi:branched-chain amino acid transport system ATP-binding protein
MTALTVAGLDAGYRDFQALFGVSLDLAEGETVALIGANGAGKSTLLMTIAGALRPWRGRITLDGLDIAGLPDHHRARLGIAIVPEGRRLFPSLTAEENILVPITGRGGPWSLDALYDLFPMVAARRSHRAGLLSGGEQQAVAIARALAANPRVLLMDEVSLGLAPAVVDGFYRLLPRIQQSGVCILLVEQDIDRALAASDRALCLLEGRVVMAGDSAGLDRDRLISAYFGAPSAPRSSATKTGPAPVPPDERVPPEMQVPPDKRVPPARPVPPAHPEVPR